MFSFSSLFIHIEYTSNIAAWFHAPFNYYTAVLFRSRTKISWR